MHIEDMAVKEVWEWLADHYGTLEDYLIALDDERESVNQRLMEVAIVVTQTRRGKALLKFVESLLDGREEAK